jgi:hypothetical protein
VNARHEVIDIEDDGYQTIEFKPREYWLALDVARYERMFDQLYDALKAADWFEVEEIIRNEYLASHGPRE